MRKIALFANLLAFSAIFLLTACSGKDFITSRAEHFVRKTYNDVDRIISVVVDTVTLGENMDYRIHQTHLLRCFDRYQDPHDYNRRMREALKKMKTPDGELIEKDCSSNWARHTWAAMCAELDVPDPTISLGMGHRIAGHRTTAIYIKRDQRKVDEANRKVIDYIKGTVPHLTT